MSVLVFLEEISIWMSRLSKTDKWASSNPLRAWIKKGSGRWWNSPRFFLTGEWRQDPPAPGFQAFRLGLELTILVPLVLRPSNCNTGFPGSLAPIFHINEIHTFWLFLWRILTNTTANWNYIPYSVFTSFYMYSFVCMCVFMCMCLLLCNFDTINKFM